MKKIKILYMLLPFLFGACSNWLDVKPSDQVDEDKLFASGTGYRTALNGIYKDMSSPSLWGSELTWGLTDVLAQNYDRSDEFLGGVGSKYNRAARYLYTDKNLQPVIQAIWSEGYNVIANCNNLITNISQEDTVKFQEKRIERDMIHGEALALRGMMHFELLRYFAPSTLAINDKAAEDKAYMPYFDKFPSIMESYLTVSGMLEKIEADLLAARNLLATIDTIEGMKHLLKTEHRFMGSSDGAPSDVFFTFRGFRMNYMAVVAELARVYSYAGELEKADECAREVIDYSVDNSGLVFKFTDKGTFGTDPKRRYDLVFALSNPKLVENFKEWTKKEDSQILTIDYGTWQEIETENPNDQRWNEDGGMLNISANLYYATMKQYTDQAAYLDRDKRTIPVIRLSELYYIRGEYAASMGNMKGAIDNLEKVSVSRGCTKGKFNWISSVDDYREAVLSDAKKEFYGEGQLYHFYKKYNIKPRKDAVFVFPLPDNETIY